MSYVWEAVAIGNGDAEDEGAPGAVDAGEPGTEEAGDSGTDEADIPVAAPDAEGFIVFVSAPLVPLAPLCEGKDWLTPEAAPALPDAVAALLAECARGTTEPLGRVVDPAG